MPHFQTADYLLYPHMGCIATRVLLLNANYYNQTHNTFNKYSQTNTYTIYYTLRTLSKLEAIQMSQKSGIISDVYFLLIDAFFFKLKIVHNILLSLGSITYKAPIIIIIIMVWAR